MLRHGALFFWPNANDQLTLTSCGEAEICWPTLTAKANITPHERRYCGVSKIIESLRASLVALHEVGAIDEVTMRTFDAICPPPIHEFSAGDINVSDPLRGASSSPSRDDSGPNEPPPYT